MSDEEQVFDFEPVAASRYDGVHECMYDCDSTAEWLVDCKTPGYTGGRAFFCCGDCSRSNRIHVKANELDQEAVDPSVAERIPDSEVIHVHDFRDVDLVTDGGAKQCADSSEPVGPFYYTGPNGAFEAWGFTFPSGYTVLEWEAVARDVETLEHAHQSVYHSYSDFRTVCTGQVDWGISPDQFPEVGK